MTQGRVFSGDNAGMPPPPPPPGYPLDGGYVPPPAQPGPPTVRKSRIWLWILLVVAVVACCVSTAVGIFGWGMFRFFEEFEPLEAKQPELPETATWTHDARHVVMQVYGEDGEPLVVAWDSEEELARNLVGYILVAIEPSSQVLWLVPADAQDAANVALDHGGGVGLGAVDSPPERLEAWNLDSGEPSTNEVSAKWAPVAGPTGWVAYYELDPLKGVMPSRLLFNTRESHGEGHRAELPEDMITFRPVGWSPSGQYVALEEMIQSDRVESSRGWGDYEDAVVHFALQPPPVDVDRRLVIVEAATGKTVAQAVLGEDVVSGIEWLDDEDVLVWYEGVSGEYPWMRALSPGSGPGDAWSVLEPEKIPHFGMVSCCLEIHGRSSAGLVLTTDVGGSAQIWTISEEGAIHRGSLPSYAAADVDENGRIAVLSYVLENYERTMTPTLELYDINGGSRRHVWAGVSRPTFERWSE